MKQTERMMVISGVKDDEESLCEFLTMPCTHSKADRRTYRIFWSGPLRSLCEGVGMVLDIGGTRVGLAPADPSEDSRALWSDWCAVGGALRHSMKRVHAK